MVNKAGSLMKYTGTAETVVIPEGIKSIREAFSSNRKIRKVILPESVIRICQNVFSSSTLQFIELPKSLTYIGQSAFSFSDLSSISLPEKLRTIENYAFAHTLLHEITIPGKVRTISYNAFSDCKKLELVRLEAGVNCVDKEAFSHCPRLKTIYVPDTLEIINKNSFVDTDIQTVYASDAWKRTHPELLLEMLPDPVEEKNFKVEGTKLIRYYGRASEPRIPPQVTTIGSDAFYFNNHITKIVIPDHVSSIESAAFFGCKNLREVILPDTITEVCRHTFCACNNLRTVRFPQDLRVIGDSALYSTDIQSLILPPAVNKLEPGCFGRCEKLSEVHIPDSIETIEPNKYSGKYDAFDPQYVKVFYVSRAWAHKHPDFIEAYPKAEFRYEEAELPIENKSKPKNSSHSVFSADRSFQIEGQKLIHYSGNESIVTIPGGITEICSHAFSNNRDLQHVTLPESVTDIGEYAFSNCSKLTGLLLPDGVQTIEKGAFAASGIEILKVPDNVRIIPERMCENCCNLSIVLLSNNVTRIEPFAFSGCNQIVPANDPDVLMNFQRVRIMEGNECLMRSVLTASKSVDTFLLRIRLNLLTSDLSSYTPYRFLLDTGREFNEKYAKASKAYIGNLRPGEQPILLFDDSMFGNGKSGFVITTQQIFYKQLWDKGSYPLSELVGFARQEDRFGFVVKNGGNPRLAFFSKAKNEDAAQKIIETLDAVCSWLKLLS